MSQDTTRAILDGLAGPVVVLDARERIAHLNAPAEELFGRALKGRHYATAFRQPGLLEMIDKVRRGAEAGRARYLRSDGGAETTYEVLVSPFEDEAGARGLVLDFEDVSHREAASQIRRDFVANVSHELRTPLTALLGFIETLQGAARDDPAARDRFLTIMEREAGRMNRLVEDLLSLSRVEQEERVRPSGSIDLIAVLRGTLSTLAPMAEEQASALQLEAPEEEITIRGDADQLQQVFQNLIENALKYGGKERPVTIRVAPVAHEPVLRAAGVAVEVVDRGEGIDPIHLPRLTERFYRIDSHRSRAMGGTGLGLAIVKHIVSRHRGRLKVSSERNRGSVFTVILPRE